MAGKRAYSLTNTTVALQHWLLVALVQGAPESDGDLRGSAAAAPVVDLALSAISLVSGIARFRGNHIWLRARVNRGDPMGFDLGVVVAASGQQVIVSPSISAEGLRWCLQLPDI